MGETRPAHALAAASVTIEKVFGWRAMFAALLYCSVTNALAEFRPCLESSPALMVAPAAPTSTQRLEITAAWDSHAKGSQLFTSRTGAVIDVTVWALLPGAPPFAKECADLFVGPLPPGAYTINFYLQRTTDADRVFQTSQSITVADAGVPPLFAFVFQGNGLPVQVSLRDQVIGSTSGPITIALVNTESVPRWLSIVPDGCGGGGTALTAGCGLQPDDFPFATDCPQTLAPGAMCTLSVSFAPRGAGPRRASLAVGSFASDGNGGTVGGTLGITKIEMSGNGVDQTIPGGAASAIPVLSFPLLLVLSGLVGGFGVVFIRRLHA